MGAWYWIGVSAGVGAAVGVLVGGVVAPGRRAMLGGALALADAAGFALGYALTDWGWIAGIAGATAAVLTASAVARGALGRGGTRGGIGVLVAGAAAALAALAFVPVIGYLETAVIPVLGARLRRRAGPTYAGLRILARD